jgi:hypothetical protein
VLKVISFSTLNHLCIHVVNVLYIVDSGQGLDSDIDFEKSNQTLFKISRELRFGQGTKAGRDSRYFVCYS